jgi:hypothetical protein
MGIGQAVGRVLETRELEACQLVIFVLLFPYSRRRMKQDKVVLLAEQEFLPKSLCKRSDGRGSAPSVTNPVNPFPDFCSIESYGMAVVHM